MTPHLPDCMMPDGAEPCKGFRELLAEADRHIKTIAGLRHENERVNTGAGEGAGKRTDIGFLLPDLLAELGRLRADNERLTAAIQRIDGINDNPAHYNSEINAVCDPILRPELSK
jgi:hypothetical protein